MKWITYSDSPLFTLHGDIAFGIDTSVNYGIICTFMEGLITLWYIWFQVFLALNLNNFLPVGGPVKVNVYLDSPWFILQGYMGLNIQTSGKYGVLCTFIEGLVTKESKPISLLLRGETKYNDLRLIQQKQALLEQEH